MHPIILQENSPKQEEKLAQKNWPRSIWECSQNISCGTFIKVPRIFTETHSRYFRKNFSPKEICWKFEILRLSAHEKYSWEFAVSFPRIFEKICQDASKKIIWKQLDEMHLTKFWENTRKYTREYRGKFLWDITENFREHSTRPIQEISPRHTGENFWKNFQQDTTEKIPRNLGDKCPTNVEKIRRNTSLDVPKKCYRDTSENISREFC